MALNTYPLECARRAGTFSKLDLTEDDIGQLSGPVVTGFRILKIVEANPGILVPGIVEKSECHKNSVALYMRFFSRFGLVEVRRLHTSGTPVCYYAVGSPPPTPEEIDRITADRESVRPPRVAKPRRDSGQKAKRSSLVRVRPPRVAAQ